MDIRYGYYLRPSAEMCQAQVRIHQLLKHQYGLRVAGRFMPHATIKGFFKTNANEDEVRSAAGSITRGLLPFPVFSQGVVGFGSLGIAISIMRNPDLSRNEPLQVLHERALTALMPLVADDCNFTPDEWLGERFEAHLTLAMADIGPAFFVEILDFVKSLEPVGPASFVADQLQLFAFESADWHGEWWHTMRWRMIDSWRLGAGD